MHITVRKEQETLILPGVPKPPCNFFFSIAFLQSYAQLVKKKKKNETSLFISVQIIVEK